MLHCEQNAFWVLGKGKEAEGKEQKPLTGETFFCLNYLELSDALNIKYLRKLLKEYIYKFSCVDKS